MDVTSFSPQNYRTAIGLSPNIGSSYSPSITWQDTSSAATYTSAAHALNTTN